MADIPAWAEALLSTALRMHGNDPRKVRRAMAGIEGMRSMYDSAERAAAYQHILDGLQKQLDSLEAPAERERGS